MYLPNRATIDEACEWLQHQTGQKWTLPRLLEEGHLVPYVWIDYVEGLSQIFGDRREGYLTKMVYHGDVVRLAADRSEALLTMFTAHDGNLIRPTPGWRVDLKDIRFLKNDLQRVAEIINKAAQPQAATPAPVADSASNAPAWTVNKPQRYSGYAAPLHRLLAAAHRDGNPCPTARDVVEAWRHNAPAEIAKVLPDGFDYYDAKGDTKTADLEAIRKAIGRMTSAR